MVRFTERNIFSSKGSEKVIYPKFKNVFFRDFSRFSEECQGYGVVGFERVTFRPSVRVCVRVSVTKRLGFGALDGVGAPSPRLLYSVGDCSMIQLNDSESLVSVLEGFSDHRARAPTGQTNVDTLFSLQKSALWV